MSRLLARIVDRDELRRLVRLALPVVAAHLAAMAMGVTDVIMVGRYDAGALAGVALGHAWVWASMVLVRGAALGLDPLLTQAVGARDQRALADALAHGVTLVVLVAIPVSAILLSAGPGLTWLDQPAESIPLAAAYAALLAPACVPVALEVVLRQGLQARGHMRPTMVVAVLGALLNVPLNGVLLYGVGSWPGVGAIGVGYASLTVQLTMVITTSWIARQELAAAWDGCRRLAWKRVRHVGSVALPVAFSFALETWGFSIGLVFVGWAGPLAIAAHTVALNVASFTFMVPLGISAAASTRVGNLLGEGSDWTRAGWTAVVMGAGVMACSGMALALGAPWVASAYLPRAEDAAVRAVAMTLLPFAAAFQVFDGIQVVAFGVLRGAGDTRIPTLANVVGFYAIGLPTAALLVSEGWGPVGVWVGLSLALFTVASILLLRLRWVARVGGFAQRA